MSHLKTKKSFYLVEEIKLNFSKTWKNKIFLTFDFE